MIAQCVGAAVRRTSSAVSAAPHAAQPPPARGAIGVRRRFRARPLGHAVTGAGRLGHRVATHMSSVNEGCSGVAGSCRCRELRAQLARQEVDGRWLERSWGADRSDEGLGPGDHGIVNVDRLRARHLFESARSPPDVTHCGIERRRRGPRCPSEFWGARERRMYRSERRAAPWNCFELSLKLELNRADQQRVIERRARR